MWWPALAATCGLHNAQCCVDDPDKGRRALGVQVIREDDLVL
jgi:hypothetical protein